MLQLRSMIISVGDSELLLQHVISWTTIVVHSSDEECGVDHEVILKPLTIFLNDDGLHITQLSEIPSTSCYRILKIIIHLTEFSTDWLTNWLTDLMPSDQQLLRVQAWLFHCSMLLQPDKFLLTYRSALNELTIVSSFVCHSSLLTAKNVDLVVASICNGNCPYYHSNYFKSFLNSCWFVLLQTWLKTKRQLLRHAAPFDTVFYSHNNSEACGLSPV